MKYNDWYEMIKNNLVNYKLNVLGIPGSGFYGKKQEDHILPRACSGANYMFDISNLVFKKHHGFHHLNSSQTMCVNFFAPMLEDNCKLLSKLLAFLLNEDVKVINFEFEYTNKKIYGDTNFDFYCQDANKHNYYFEIKYTEQGIAKKCSAKDQSDENLIKVYDEKYRDNVESDGSQLVIDNPLIFMKEHYQAFRNISCANEVKNNYCFFITMEGNEKTKNELNEALSYVKSDKYVKSLYWESIVQLALELVEDDPELFGYYLEFKNKYSL